MTRVPKLARDPAVLLVVLGVGGGGSLGCSCRLYEWNLWKKMEGGFPRKFKLER